MKGSIIIVSFFVLGILVSLYGLFPFDPQEYNLSFYALCALMFCVGISVGSDSKTLLSFRRINPRFFLLPRF